MPLGRRPDQASHPPTQTYAVAAKAGTARPQHTLCPGARFRSCASATPGNPGSRPPAPLDDAGCNPTRMACHTWTHRGVLLRPETPALGPSHSWCLSRKPDAFASAHLAHARASARRLRWENIARVKLDAPPRPVSFPCSRAGCQGQVFLRLRWA